MARSTSLMLSLVLATGAGVLIGCQGSGNGARTSAMLAGWTKNSARIGDRYGGSGEFGGATLSFRVKGAPQDKVEAVFFYVDVTNKLAGRANANTYQAIEHLGNILDIEVNMKTQQGQQKALNEIESKLEGSTLDREMKAEISKAWKRFAISARMANLAIDSANSLVDSAQAIPDSVQSNPVQYGLNAVSYIDKVPKAVEDMGNVVTETTTFVEYNAHAIKLCSKIGSANGIEQPSSSEVKSGYTKECSNAIGVNENDFEEGDFN